MGISFLFMALGLFYRIASISAFLLFTYVELLDKSNYLNHYYFVSLVCLLMIFVPAQRYFSLDVRRKPSLKRTYLPNYFIFIFQLQLSIVYFYAGIAKLNYDWIVNALPLKIWLPARQEIPLVGSLLQKEWVAYLFSWFGAVYDLSIPFLLFNKKTRRLAYFFVIVFHIATYTLFQIGMFPFIMIGATLIFFSEDFHLKLLGKLREVEVKRNNFRPRQKLTGRLLLGVFFLAQLLIPFRYLAYPGNLFWTEEGYRFSWRVMLMEKAAYAIFHVHDPESGRNWEVNNYDFLTPNQEKMMSTQPDMILQFAHYLESHYQQQGINDPVIKAEVYATLNGRPSRLYLDSSVDLTLVNESFKHKEWILPFQEE
jgi:hypothetical protein